MDLNEVSTFKCCCFFNHSNSGCCVQNNIQRRCLLNAAKIARAILQQTQRCVCVCMHKTNIYPDLIAYSSAGAAVRLGLMVCVYAKQTCGAEQKNARGRR